MTWRTDIPRTLTFQRRVWQLQRLGWVGLCAWIGLGMAGLIGPGPCNGVRDGTADGAVGLDRERVLHRGAPTPVRISIPARGRLTRLELRADASWEIAALVPAPRIERLTAEGREFEFASRGAERLAIDLRVIPRGSGLYRSEVRVEGHPPLGFSQLVLP
jgi:hypothetical protein